MANRTTQKRPNKQLSKSIYIILMLLLLLIGTDIQIADAGMAEGLTEGIKYAGQMFGINTAADVADLVARAFSSAASTTAQAQPDFFSTLFQRQQKPSSPSYHSEEDNLQQSTTHKRGEHQTNENFDNGIPTPAPAKENVLLNFGTSQIITSVLRMIGFDARKLGALALNAIVMIAQALGNTLLGAFSPKKSIVSAVDGGRLFMNENSTPTSTPTSNEESSHTHNNDEYRPRKLRSGSPVDWYLKNPTEEMKQLLSHAMNPKLADDLADMIADVEKSIPNGQNSAACVKMLMCKCSPFIWGMQRSLEKRIKGTTKSEDEENERGDENAILNTSIFYKHLPSMDEYRKHSAICQQRYGNHCKPQEMIKRKK